MGYTDHSYWSKRLQEHVPTPPVVPQSETAAELVEAISDMDPLERVIHPNRTDRQYRCLFCPPYSAHTHTDYRSDFRHQPECIWLRAVKVRLEVQY